MTDNTSRWLTRGSHKRMDSDMKDAPWNNSTNREGAQEKSWKDCPSSPTLVSPSQALSRKFMYSTGMTSRENSGTLNLIAQGMHHEESTSTNQSVVLEGYLVYKGVKVRVKSSHTSLSWKPAAGAMACCLELASLKTKLPYDEILSAWCDTRVRGCSCLCRSDPVVVVAALHRPRINPADWKLKEHTLVAASTEQAKEWVAAINAALQLCYDRPRTLLVFINPYSGSKRARYVWEANAAPIFFKAGIKFHVIETQHADHCRTLLGDMKADELSQYQGVVAVGGDGVFQECVMGLIAQRARGGKNAAVAARMRVGHIPGGSTDAVAYTINGTRCAEAAALHIALGDRMSLDVARVDCIGGGNTGVTPRAASPAPDSSSHSLHCGSTLNSTHGGGASSSPPTAGTPSNPKSRRNSHTLQRNSNSLISALTQGDGLLHNSSNSNNQKSIYEMSSCDPGGRLLNMKGACSSDEDTSWQSLRPGDAINSSAVTNLGQQQQQQQQRQASAALGTDVERRNSSGSGGSEKVDSVADRISNALPSRYFVCQAAYGFLGDVMKFSEGLRFMGPSRYDVSGFIQFLKLKTYPLSITYQAAPCDAADRLPLCMSKCEGCRLAGINMPRASADTDRTQQQDSFLDSGSDVETATPGSSSVSYIAGLPPPLLQRFPSTPLSCTAHHANNNNASSPALAGMGGMNNGSKHGNAAIQPQAGSAMNGLGRASGSPHLRQSAAGQGSPTHPARAQSCSYSQIPPPANVNDGPVHDDAGWVTVQGEYVSVMAVVTPCRSDKSKAGILPHAHLSDGRIYLVLVSKCSRLDYLRFLIRLSSKGLQDGCFPFVKIIPISAAVIRPTGSAAATSVWNVDGELLPQPGVSLRVARGVVDVFARGIESEV